MLRGAQTPRVRLEPRARRSDADDAGFLSAGYGLVLDEWQSLVLSSWLGVRPDGQWASRRCGLAVPRQNGKNAILEVRELFGMIVLGEKFLHTAHEVKTARKAFKRISSFFDEEMGAPAELASMVEDIRKTNGQEAIVLRNGGSVEFVARSKGSARGFTVDVLVMDEAQELGEDAIEALLPTISAAPLGNPQQIFTGTPPGPKAAGEIFTRVRDDGHEGRDKALSWHEWSCTADADLDDVGNLAASNPALGVRLHRDVTDAERGTLSDAGFGRERLGMWDEAGSNRVIDAVTWGLLAPLDGEPVQKVSSRLALGVDVAPDRSTSSVSFAGQRANGSWHVELDEQRHGVGWLVEYIVTRCERNDIRAVVIDGASAAASIVDSLLARKIKVTTTGPREMGQACGLFYDGAVEGWLHHIDQPQLNLALSAARKRPLGDAWAWNKKNASLDITALVAATLALWGAQSSTVQKPSRSHQKPKVVVMS